MKFVLYPHISPYHRDTYCNLAFPAFIIKAAKAAYKRTKGAHMLNSKNIDKWNNMKFGLVLSGGGAKGA